MKLWPSRKSSRCSRAGKRRDIKGAVNWIQKARKNRVTESIVYNITGIFALYATVLNYSYMNILDILYIRVLDSLDSRL